jgi:hypothetical protein
LKQSHIIYYQALTTTQNNPSFPKYICIFQYLEFLPPLPAIWVTFSRISPGDKGRFLPLMDNPKEIGATSKRRAVIGSL